MARINTIKTFCIFCCALAVLVFFRTPALAAPDEDLQTLEMFYEGKDLAVSATRAPKPLSQTAENVTVVTAAEIEMMGAHTLTDVLNNVPGLQTDDQGSIGTFTGVTIQGSDFEHVLVMQDGVVLNFIGAGLADIAVIPVQNIDRIEIIKGPGSSSWGSALGGVINIVTKSPDEERKIGGALSFSAGDRQTRDTRGEASGSMGHFGYYLYADHLTSGGFRPHTPLDTHHLFSKFRWDFPERGSLVVTLGYTKQTIGQGQDLVNLFDVYDIKRNFVGNIAWNYHLNDRTDLDLSLRSTSKYFNDTGNLFTDPPSSFINLTRETTHGGSAKLTWRGGVNALAAGTDFDHLDLNYEGASTRFKSDQWGVFLNDTVTLGDFSLTPGIRFDRLHQLGNFISPSLGATWSMDDKTVLRLYAARGYSLPVLNNFGIDQEKVFTLQAGAETTHIPYLWIKTTLFRNQISDHLDFDANFNPILVRLLKQGVEVEARTVPIFNTHLSAGYTFVEAKNRDTGETLIKDPRQIAKLGVHYDDRDSFRATLYGRYVWWNGSLGLGARDNAVIWDLNLAWKVLRVHDTALELFFSAHNLFNGAQYSNETYKGTPRWLEGGARFNF